MKNPILLFDNDGVLLDSNAIKFNGEVFREVFEGDERRVAHVSGLLLTAEGQALNRYQLIHKVLVETGRSDLADLSYDDLKINKDILFFTQRYSDAIRGAILKSGIFPWTYDVIKKLHNEGFRMYVISGAEHADVLYLIEQSGLRDFFIEVFGFGWRGNDSGGMGKKETFEYIASLEGSRDPERYRVIGDGFADYDLAKYIGCRFFGVSNNWNGWNAESDLDGVIVSDTREVVNILLKNE